MVYFNFSKAKSVIKEGAIKLILKEKKVSNVSLLKKVYLL